ncbi:MAG: hypothetical protein RBR08_10745 [Desulforegulaceae bacterium]|jgi:hypothetical protein|nr:hypothetical protein [Desulforegulaceae bacterium]
MSCLSEFKVVSILGDKSQDLINENLSEKNLSFLKRIKNKISKKITGKIFKFFFGDII